MPHTSTGTGPTSRDLKLSSPDYSPDRSIPAKIKRRLTQFRTAKKLGEMNGSMITFSFDDFPKSAADTGADILASIDAPAIYYACSGLAGRENQTGAQFDETDLAHLVAAGHEIGAHTHTHLDCATASLSEAVADIDANLERLKAMGLKNSVRHFAYPYGETTVALKTSLCDTFDTCRGILPGHNGAQSDAMQLKAMEVTSDPASTDRALHAIEAATRQTSWLHIFTHDVRDRPSAFGTSPQAFRKITRAARASGLPIVTPSQAIKEMTRA